MSCCPSPPKVVVGADFVPATGPENTLRPEETVECFSKRAGNTTGKHDDATENRLEKIANESITSDASGKVNIQFKLTDGSVSQDVGFIMLSPAIPGLSFTGAGVLSGTVLPPALGTKITVRIQANARPLGSAPGTQVGPIDDRTYTFSPSVVSGSDSIQFVSPLPGGIVNSPFGMRMHPLKKVEKLHTGIDMKIRPGVDGDVVAAADGIVLKAANTDPRGYGNSIHIKHFTGSGKHLCTTSYNHLAKFYVAVGQKVMAGQAIAREGGAKGVPGSGGSSGLHLHFECILPNGTKTDPQPYIRGELKVAGSQTPDGEAVPASVSTTTGSSVITETDVQAKQGCPEMGTPEYPGDPALPEPPAEAAPVSSSGEPFDLAWHFTMKQEVGQWWSGSAGAEPTDPELLAGLIETKEQRKKCGLNIDGGGLTKFGISAKGNPKTDIKTLDYTSAKAIGHQNYWKGGIIKPKNLPKWVSVFMFDVNYNHGMGNAKSIYNDAGVSVTMSSTKEEQLAAIDKLYQSRLAFTRSMKNKREGLAIATRTDRLYQYVKSIA